MTAAENGSSGRRPPAAGPGTRPRTVLVLGGGGLRGAAHAGVVRALERLGIEAAECCATSFGAVIGAAWAASRSASEIAELVAAIAASEVFAPLRLAEVTRGAGQAAAARGQAYRALLRDALPEHFADLQRPFFCHALALGSGAVVPFGLPSGRPISLPDAVYAASCTPGLLQPLELWGELWVDGGLAEGLALRLAHSRDAELVIAADISRRDPAAARAAAATPAGVLDRLATVLGAIAVDRDLHELGPRAELVLIQPRVDEGAPSALEGADDLLRAGEAEAVLVLATDPRTRYWCAPEVVREVDRTVSAPRDHVRLDVDTAACINCGLCAVTCPTGGYAAVPFGSVVRKLHHYECLRDAACVRACPTSAIRLA